eukprot:4767256-Prymnesium_polylepis.1
MPGRRYSNRRSHGLRPNAMTTTPPAHVTPDALQKHSLCALCDSLQSSVPARAGQLDRRSRDDAGDDAQPAPDADPDLSAAGRARRANA